MNPVLRCIIVDDEPVARKILREFIEDVDFMQLCGEAEDAIKATKLLQNEKIDLVLLDIQMPKMTGLDFIKTNIDSAPIIILTTAYTEYALEGYELNVVDYLVKPIEFKRFFKAANKALNIYQSKKQPQIIVDEHFFFIKCNQKIEKIFFNEVLYIEGMANYIIIHTIDKKYISYFSFKSLESFLPQQNFVRIHKSYIVSINAIRSIEENIVHFAKSSLPISKHYKKDLLNKINPHFFKR